MPMFLYQIIRLFRSGNVCVCGLVGTGKDMLMANVAVRRRKPYVSNVNYGGDWRAFRPSDFSCGYNSYKNFISGNLNHYVFPYPEGTDIYISDAGVYFPAQYCNELNRDYGYFATFMALVRHLTNGGAVYTNAQNLNRVWDKIREQSDLYIMCKRCDVLFGKLVIQKVVLYESYDSAVKRVPVFRLRKPLLNADRRLQWELAKTNYDIAHGSITGGTLIYWNKSKYNSRFFKEVLENAPIPKTS